MGINRQGNNRRVQKTEIETLLDFRELSIHKSNRVITKNFTAYITGAETKFAKLLTFLIFEAKRNNVLEFNTHLLVKYGEYLEAVQKKFGNEVKTRKTVMFNRNDFQQLVRLGIIVPIVPKEKLFLINPALTYHEGYYNEQATFMKAYEQIYSMYSVGAYSKNILHGLIVTASREFYNNCLNKKI
jgi:hypothetical protein